MAGRRRSISPRVVGLVVVALGLLLFGGLFLLTRAAGPMLLPTVPLWPILGAALLFVAFILAARVLAGVFIADRE